MYIYHLYQIIWILQSIMSIFTVVNSLKIVLNYD